MRQVKLEIDNMTFQILWELLVEETTFDVDNNSSLSFSSICLLTILDNAGFGENNEMLLKFKTSISDLQKIYPEITDEIIKKVTPRARFDQFRKLSYPDWP